MFWFSRGLALKEAVRDSLAGCNRLAAAKGNSGPPPNSRNPTAKAKTKYSATTKEIRRRRPPAAKDTALSSMRRYLIRR